VIEQALKAIDMDPNFYLTHPTLGCANIATVYVALGDRDQAFARLEKAYEVRTQYLAWLKLNPELDSLHPDPRFQDLLRRVGLPQ